MSMMSEIHAAMTDAGVIGEYEHDMSVIDELTARIDALRAAPVRDEAEYESQMREILELQRSRRRAHARADAMLDRFAGRVVRRESSCNSGSKLHVPGNIATFGEVDR